MNIAVIGESSDLTFDSKHEITRINGCLLLRPWQHRADISDLVRAFLDPPPSLAAAPVPPPPVAAGTGDPRTESSAGSAPAARARPPLPPPSSASAAASESQWQEYLNRCRGLATAVMSGGGDAAVAEYWDWFVRYPWSGSAYPWYGVLGAYLRGYKDDHSGGLPSPAAAADLFIFDCPAIVTDIYRHVEAEGAGKRDLPAEPEMNLHWWVQELLYPWVVAGMDAAVLTDIPSASLAEALVQRFFLRSQGIRSDYPSQESVVRELFSGGAWEMHTADTFDPGPVLSGRDSSSVRATDGAGAGGIAGIPGPAVGFEHLSLYGLEVRLGLRTDDGCLTSHPPSSAFDPCQFQIHAQSEAGNPCCFTHREKGWQGGIHVVARAIFDQWCRGQSSPIAPPGRLRDLTGPAVPQTSSVQLPLSPPAAPEAQYLIRLESDVCRVVFDGDTVLFGDKLGIRCIAYLLLHPNEAIHATILVAKTNRHTNRLETVLTFPQEPADSGGMSSSPDNCETTSDRGGGGMDAVVDSESGEEIPVGMEAILQQADLNADTRKGNASLLNDLREMLEERTNALKDPEISDAKRDQLEKEEESILGQIRYAHGTSRETGTKAHDRVRKAIKRFLNECLEPGNGSTMPEATREAFEKHLEEFLVGPSKLLRGQGRRAGKNKAARGSPQSYIYKPPLGVEWSP